MTNCSNYVDLQMAAKKGYEQHAIDMGMMPSDYECLVPDIKRRWLRIAAAVLHTHNLHYPVPPLDSAQKKTSS